MREKKTLTYIPGCRVWSELPALKWKVGESESREPKDPKVHRLEGQGLLALVEGDPVEAG